MKKVLYLAILFLIVGCNVKHKVNNTPLPTDIRDSIIFMTIYKTDSLSCKEITDKQIDIIKDLTRRLNEKCPIVEKEKKPFINIEIHNKKYKKNKDSNISGVDIDCDSIGKVNVELSETLENLKKQKNKEKVITKTVTKQIVKSNKIWIYISVISIILLIVTNIKRIMKLIKSFTWLRLIK